MLEGFRNWYKRPACFPLTAAGEKSGVHILASTTADLKWLDLRPFLTPLGAHLMKLLIAFNQTKMFV